MSSIKAEGIRTIGAAPAPPAADKNRGAAAAVVIHNIYVNNHYQAPPIEPPPWSLQRIPPQIRYDLLREYRRERASSQPWFSQIHFTSASIPELMDHLNKRLVEHVVIPSSLTNILIIKLADSGNFSEAEHLFNNIPKQLKTLYTYTSMVDIYGKAGLVDKAKALFHTMHLEPNITTCTAMINAYGEAELWKKAEDLFYRMPFNPCSQACLSLINAYRKAGQWEKAEIFFKHMFTSDANIVTCTTMINIYGEAGLWERAELLFNVMPFEPTAHTYLSMISIYGKAGQWKKAERLFKSIPFTADAITYHCMIDTYGSSGLWDEAQELFIKLLPRISDIIHESESLDLLKGQSKIGQIANFDLHGANFATTALIIQRIVELNPHISQFNLITGHGLHRRNSENRENGVKQGVYKAVEMFIRGWNVEEHPRNPGRLILHKSRKREADLPLPPRKRT